MNKFQIRLYFLYPFLSGVAHYFFNLFFHNFLYGKVPLGEKDVLLFLYIFAFLGLFVFCKDKENNLALIISGSGSAIIFALLVYVSIGREFDFIYSLRIVIFSLMHHLIWFVLFVVLLYFFEWIFDIKKKEKKPPCVEAE